MADHKRYSYKVYDPDNLYIGVWDDDVVSDFDTTEEINSAGSQLRVRLARPADDFGEGVDVDFEYKVFVDCFDDDNPNGVSVFSGYIASYSPLFIGNDEYVEINVWGFGAKLDNYIIETGELSDVSQVVEDTFSQIGSNADSQVYSDIQTWIAGESGILSRIELLMAVTSGAGNRRVNVNIYSGTPPTEISMDSLPGSPIASGTVMVTSETGTTYSILLGAGVELVEGNSYYFEVLADAPVDIGSGKIKVYYKSSADAYADGQMYVSTNNVADNLRGYFVISSDHDLYFTTYMSSGNTTAPFLSTDPSDILRAIIDDYQLKGGVLGYDSSTIEDTGTTVSYTFNTNTTFEGIKKVLELAPAGWYFYIDQALNKIHFHQKGSVADHNFALGKHILELKPEKRTEDIVNTVYFTGGGDPPLFIRFSDSNSVSRYGVRIRKYVDQRVTLTATASAIAQSILQERGEAELRLNTQIVDNALDATRGYDLESITVGQMIGIRNVEGAGPSLWDVSEWDVAYWDYNIQDITSVILQIVRIERTPEFVNIFCSTTPPDVAKRIEDINRNLEATQTAANPTAPEIGE